MELCPKCDTALRISATKYVLREIDDKVKLFVVQELTCRNPACPNNGVVVDTVESEQPLSNE